LRRCRLRKWLARGLPELENVLDTETSQHPEVLLSLPQPPHVFADPPTGGPAVNSELPSASHGSEHDVPALALVDGATQRLPGLK
jgi:hypothetical protein